MFEKKNKSQAWWCVLVIPAMERQRQMGPWGWLAGKLSLLSESQANERPLSQKTKTKYKLKRKNQSIDLGDSLACKLLDLRTPGTKLWPPHRCECLVPFTAHLQHSGRGDKVYLRQAGDPASKDMLQCGQGGHSVSTHGLHKHIHSHICKQHTYTHITCENWLINN